MEIMPKILLHLFKDFITTQTITSLAKNIGLSRVGIWKILQKPEMRRYFSSKAVGLGKTSTSIIKLDWNDPLLEKALALYLSEEALTQRRWQVNFAELEKEVDFLILYGSIISSSKTAGDIDLLYIAKQNKFVKIQQIIDRVQKTQPKKIHAIGLTSEEFRWELKKPNKAFIDAIKKGVILFGQEKFIKFMWRISQDG